MQTEHAHATDTPPILDRPESTGFWGKAWPVLVLGFITLLLIRACIPSGVAPPPPFDVKSATQSANTQAMTALDAVTATTPLETALKALNMPVVNFASGSSEIPADAKPVLGKAAEVMKALPAPLRLEISGHTDSTGTADKNMLLSRQRAQAVADFLLERGVPRERLHAQGFGDGRPVATNATEEGRFYNRRIEVKSLTR